MLTITGHIDNFDGLTIRTHADRDMYEVRAFTFTGEFPNTRTEHILGVTFSPSLLEQARFIEEAGKSGKKLRITVEAVE